VAPELLFLKRALIIMTDDYEHAVNHVMAVNDTEYVDFHARRMVEMAGYIIMGYLLVLDANRDREYMRSARNFIRLAKSTVRSNAGFIGDCSVDDLASYKYL